MAHPPPVGPPVRPARPGRGLERLRRKVLAPLFARLGYDLLPATPEWEHRPVSEREVERLIAEAARRLAADFAAAGLDAGGSLEHVTRDFWTLIRSCPVRQRHGGNGFNGSLQIYALARTLRPSVIIESGVFRGLTTWLLRRACPDARLFCCDPVLSGLHYRDETARYLQGDWSRLDFTGIDLGNALAFFDDHVSQAQRVIEASERGVRSVIFDDNVCAHRIHSHGGPAYPTLDMILADGTTDAPIRWLRNGREFVYRPDPELAGMVRGRIEAAHNFDDLHSATGYSPSRVSYVRLRAPRERMAALRGASGSVPPARIGNDGARDDV